jgi:predicted ATP-grasp superfamily ATP-dependent carboligase
MPPSAALPYPGPEPLRALRTKSRLPELAAAAGLATPPTIFEGQAGEVGRSPARFPVVVKPAGPGGALVSACFAETPDELRALLRTLPADEPLIIQDHRAATLIGVIVVLDREGAVVARFQQRARRTWPPSAGETSLGVSVEPEERFVERAADVLRAARYWGLAQLQFLETRRRRELIDVNTRFYGSMPLALACGVNPASAWHAVVTGGRLPRPAPYRTGVTYRWLEADFTGAVRGSPRLLLQRAPRPKAGSMWARDDPLASAALGASVLVPPLRRRAAGLLPGWRRQDGTGTPSGPSRFTTGH